MNDGSPMNESEVDFVCAHIAAHKTCGYSNALLNVYWAGGKEVATNGASCAIGMASD